MSLTFPAVKNTRVITDSASIRRIPRVCALHLTFEWELGFVYCHSRSTRALNEDPRSNLCETWAHSSWAADTRPHLLLVKTVSKWFLLEYSSWTRVPRSTFIKWMLKALPVTYAERNWHPHMYVPQLFEGFRTRTKKKSRLKTEDAFLLIASATVSLSIMAPSFSPTKYYSSFITQHVLALQIFTSCARNFLSRAVRACHLMPLTVAITFGPEGNLLP